MFRIARTSHVLAGFVVCAASTLGAQGGRATQTPPVQTATPTQAAASMPRAAPTAVIKGPLMVLKDSVAKFDGSGSTSVPAGHAMTYQWNFGDGTTGTGPTVTHKWSTPNSNSVVVTLIVTDGTFKSAPVTQTVVVRTIPPGGGGKKP